MLWWLPKLSQIINQIKINLNKKITGTFNDEVLSKDLRIYDRIDLKNNKILQGKLRKTGERNT